MCAALQVLVVVVGPRPRPAAGTGAALELAAGFLSAFAGCFCFTCLMPHVAHGRWLGTRLATSRRSRTHPASLLFCRHSAHLPVDHIGHKPVALRLAHRPARQYPAQPLLVGFDPPPRCPGVPADEGEVACLLAQSLVGRGLEAFHGLVALLAGVPLDAGPVAFDEV